MKILFLITDLSKGGAERILLTLCQNLNKRDDVELVIGNLYGANLYKQLSSNLRIVDLNYKTNKLFEKSYTPELHKLIEEFNPDIVHTNRFLAEYITLELLSYNLKFVCHFHDNIIQFKKIKFLDLFSKKKLLNFIEKTQVYRLKYKHHNTHFVSISEDTTKYMNQVLPSNLKGNIVLIENSIDLNNFRTKEKRKFNTSDKLNLINVGSFQNKKNQTFFIDIAIELKKRNIDFMINLIGDGELRKEVENRIADNQLEDMIKTHGIVDNVEEWMENSNIYVHTAWYEPFGLVLIEAMASGLPCISLDGKGNQDLIENDYNGYFIGNQDPQLFADKIDEISKNEELYYKLSKNAEKFSLKFNIEEKTQDYVDLYTSIIQQN